jgi:hypothetical protein
MMASACLSCGGTVLVLASAINQDHGRGLTVTTRTGLRSAGSQPLRRRRDKRCCPRETNATVGIGGRGGRANGFIGSHARPAKRKKNQTNAPRGKSLTAPHVCRRHASTVAAIGAIICPVSVHAGRFTCPLWRLAVHPAVRLARARSSQAHLSAGGLWARVHRSAQRCEVL